MTRTSARAGMSMIEVVISAAIVSMLALVILSANVPLTRASSEVGVAFDMDRAAGKFLSELRREVRQSGYNVAQRQVFRATSGTSALWFRTRRSFGDVVDDTATSNWNRQTRYTLVASPLGSYGDGTARFRVTRTQPDPGGLVVDVLDNVRSLTFDLIPGPEVPTGATLDDAANDGVQRTSLQVDLVLARENPSWRGTGPDRFIVRTYGEVIEFLNKQQ